MDRQKKVGIFCGCKRKSIWKDKASWQLLSLCIIGIVGYILFNYVPMVSALIIPFKNYKFSKGILGSEWSGLANFTVLMKSASFLRAVRNTLLYGLWFLFLKQLLNVTLAILLFEIKNRKALKFYQTVFSFPNFMSMVVVGYVTYAILAPTNGLLNSLIVAFGGEKIDVYTIPSVWPLILTIVSEWKGVGMGCLVYFASLMAIDVSLFEAAEIDGASRWQRIRYITIPHLVPLVCIYLIMNSRSVISVGFDLFYIIPKNIGLLYPTTDVIATYNYRAMVQGTYAQGSAVSLMQSLIGLILVVISNAIVKKISPENSMF